MTFKNPLVPLLGVCLLLCTSVEGQFVDRALEYGVDHHFNDLGFGSGLSLIDINGDGRDDLTFGTEFGASLVVYLQTDSGFTQMTEVSFMEATQATRGLNWVDYDNDGDKDLFFTYGTLFTGGGFSLYNQNEFGQFTDVTWSSGLFSIDARWYGSTWADYDNDGFLDLYVCNLNEFGSNALYHNDGDGTFSEMTVALGVDDPEGFAYNSVFFDADLDGDLDLFTSHDRYALNRLHENLNYQSFQDVSIESGVGQAFNAMGVELGDYDNDMDFDLYVTNIFGNFIGGQGNVLYRNIGLGFELLPGSLDDNIEGTFWGCNFIDYDYDRDLDLFTVNSLRNASTYGRYFYINNGNGVFSNYEGDEFNVSNGVHFATAQGDLNSDGFLDLVVGNGSSGNSEIWIGPATDNHWVKVHLEGTVSNRDGIGALIEVWADGVKRIDQTTCTSSHLAQDSNSYPFGLGSHPQADTITIRWPSGIVNKLYDIPSGNRIHVVENADQETIICMPEVEWTLPTGEGLTQDFHFSTEEDLTSVNWSIDDQIIGSDDSLSYTFPGPGEYEICLLVSNSCASQTWCQSITVSCTTASPEIEWEQDLLTFNAELTNAYDSVFWNLGDGTLLTGDSLSHTYDESGVYTICAQVFDQCGTDSLCWDIEMTCPVPLPQVVWTQDLLTLSAELTNSYDSIVWDLGDGTFFTADDFIHTYEESGIYSICAQVFDPCGTDSLCWDIEMTCPVPLPQVVWTQDLLTLSAELTNSYDSIVWDLGDGTFFTADDFTHTYEESGIYSICAQVFDPCGTDSLCWDIEMICPSPEVDFTYELDGFDLLASSYSIGNDSLVWTLNGAVFSQDSTVLVGLEPGQYELCLLALNTCGSDSMCATLDITPLGSMINDGQHSLSIYPNPVHDELVIDFGDHGVVPILLTVFDLSGRQIPTAFKMMAIMEQKGILNTSQMDPGLYLLEVEFASGNLIRLPFFIE